MLDQHAKKPLDRTPERAMHHHGLVPVAIFANVLEAESDAAS